jgi:hypothetical protein
VLRSRWWLLRRDERSVCTSVQSRRHAKPRRSTVTNAPNNAREVYVQLAALPAVQQLLQAVVDLRNKDAHARPCVHLRHAQRRARGAKLVCQHLEVRLHLRSSVKRSGGGAAGATLRQRVCAAPAAAPRTFSRGHVSELKRNSVRL